MKTYDQKNSYFGIKYDDKARWASYWQQINEVLRLKPQSVLEIGVGNGLVSWYLKFLNFQVTTLDINENLNPDFTGSVLDMPFPDDSFDLVLCAEVLEHLPFEQFSKALSGLRRISNNYIVLSLPHWGWTFRCLFKIPVFPAFQILWKLSGVLGHKSGEHRWEIGKRGYSLRKIKKAIMAQNFKILNHFIIFENPYHHFFILQKMKNNKLL